MVTGSGAPTASMVYKFVEVDGISVQAQQPQGISGRTKGGDAAVLPDGCCGRGTDPSDLRNPDTRGAFRRLTIPLVRGGRPVSDCDLATARALVASGPQSMPWEDWPCPTANPRFPPAGCHRHDHRSPAVAGLLEKAVCGTWRHPAPGQVQMAEAVAKSFDTGEHLAVQAGTGTGKSLAYLVPSIARAVTGDSPSWCRRRRSPCSVNSSTGTARLADALVDELPRRPRFAVLKGRRNYLCLNKIHSGAAGDEDADTASQEELFQPRAISALGRDIQRLAEWADSTETGDRDDLKPGVPERSWSQVSVSARECLEPLAARPEWTASPRKPVRRPAAPTWSSPITRCWPSTRSPKPRCCPSMTTSLSTRPTSSSTGSPSVATGELTPGPLGVALRRLARLVGPELRQRMEAAVATFSSSIHDAQPGRIDHLDDEMATHLTALRDAASAARASIDPSPRDPAAAAARSETIAALSEIADTARRVVDSFGPAIPDRTDVVWIDHETVRGADDPAGARVAPLSVSDLLRKQVFESATVVLTSATLTIGGSFEAMAHVGPARFRRPRCATEVPMARTRRGLPVRPRQIRHPLHRGTYRPRSRWGRGRGHSTTRSKA